MRLTRRGRIVAALGIPAAIAVIVAAAGLVYLRSIGVIGSSAPGARVSVTIPEGSGATAIGRLLERQRVIDSAFGFRIALYLDGGGDEIQAGEYELRRGMTAGDALAELEDGPVIEFVTVTFPEGAWLTDFARIVDDDAGIPAEDFMRAATSGRIRSRYSPPDVDTLEGLLFPSTYQIVESDTAESVVRRLVDEMEQQTAELDFDRVRATGVSPYEAVIVASMVEAEAAVDAERPKIARVIYNRLNEDIPLGIDATVIYALGEHKETLTESDLQVDSPYNTRRVTGLPPTPIGAPGLASLRAAVEPADGDWLYYVLSDCEGHHAFSVDYDDFLRDKAAYQELEC